MEWWNPCGIHSIPCGIWVEWNHQNGWDITQNIFHVEWVESIWNDMDSIWIPCGMWGESKDLQRQVIDKNRTVIRTVLGPCKTHWTMTFANFKDAWHVSRTGLTHLFMQTGLSIFTLNVQKAGRDKHTVFHQWTISFNDYDKMKVIKQSKHFQLTGNYVEGPARWDGRTASKEYKFTREISMKYRMVKLEGWVR